ncbi:MAG: mechanosensitive ion channel [Nitrosomonadales bacterium]|jgi:miniconductance mechanosensitive channel|nr:mechanosensitive ion channel [Nitrosomonadales bacterium]MBT6355889.1 mechanosensitive ion channel [Nitrosomonadales bacterium]
MLDEVISFYSFLGLNFELTAALSILQVVLIIFALAFVAHFITKNVIIKHLRKTFLFRENVIKEVFFEFKPFENAAHLVAAIVIYSFADLITTDDSSISWINESVGWLEEGGVIYATLAIIWFFMAFINLSNSYYERIKKDHQPSIKGYLQLVKIIIIATAVVLIVSMLLDKSPMAFLTGLGAASAIIILVFKDTILGFVASVQVASYDMVRVGDWITINKLKVDGDIEDVSLNTVKIRNFDKTVTTIPTSALIENGVQNWRGMTETKGRRIKRSINIDIKTIKFCDETLLNKLSKVTKLKKYITDKTEEIKSHNAKINAKSEDLNGRALTNIGLFRNYIYNYLKENEHIRNDLTLLIRQLQPGQSGIPIEIYVFTNDTNWVNYENIQSDIFDHLLAALPMFELAAFQIISDTNKQLPQA